VEVVQPNDEAGKGNSKHRRNVIDVTGHKEEATRKKGKPKKTAQRAKTPASKRTSQGQSEEIIQRKSSRHRESVHSVFWNSVAVQTQPHPLRAPPKTTLGEASS